MKRRLLRVASRYGIVLGIGLLYFGFVSLTKIGIPCPFRLITGLQCPGCGISRMLMAVIRLDFVSAFHYNPVVFLTSPILLFLILLSDLDYIRTGRSSANRFQAVWIAELAILLAFGVIRNLT
ncbi:MAG: DUF2752 domain-containing protein [Clostridia bacterium]|nr:DUF2752 domain-containing protein [Clostridia bacterium]